MKRKKEKAILFLICGCVCAVCFICSVVFYKTNKNQSHVTKFRNSEDIFQAKEELNEIILFFTENGLTSGESYTNLLVVEKDINEYIETERPHIAKRYQKLLDKSKINEYGSRLGISEFYFYPYGGFLFDIELFVGVVCCGTCAVLFLAFAAAFAPWNY